MEAGTMPEVEQEVDDALTQELDGDVAGSIAGDLSSERQRIAAKKDTHIEIPGYRGKLFAHYERMERPDVMKIIEKWAQSKHPDKDLMTQAQTIAAACVEICVKVKDGKPDPHGDMIPLSSIVPGNDGTPIRYDNELGKFLGFEADGSAIKAVLATFNNELAVGPHHAELVAWMQSSESEDDEDFIRASSAMSE